MSDTTHIIIENVVDERFRIKWTVGYSYTYFEGYEIREGMGDNVLYLLDGAPSSAHLTDDMNKAEKYIQGSIKWDGCSEMDQGQHHWCGLDDYKLHVALLKYLYNRASELMFETSELGKWND